MKHKYRYRLCSLVVTVSFVVALICPQSLWASCGEDTWEDTKDGLKIAGIVTGSILGLSILIVLIVGALSELSDDEIILMKGPYEKSLQASLAGFGFGPTDALLSPKSIDRLASVQQPEIISPWSGRYRPVGICRPAFSITPPPSSKTRFSLDLPLGRSTHSGQDQPFSLGIGLNPTLLVVGY